MADEIKDLTISTNSLEINEKVSKDTNGALQSVEKNVLIEDKSDHCSSDVHLQVMQEFLIFFLNGIYK